MPATLGPPKPVKTLSDRLKQLGDIPPERIRAYPPLGKATERDLLDALDKGPGICELVDGVLVEKPIGYEESFLAMYLGHLLNAFVLPRKLGRVSGADGHVRLFPRLARAPDVAFASFKRFPGGRLSKAAIPKLVPDLAVEVLRRSNTPAEMKRKEYLRSGVGLVWIIDPAERTVDVFAARRKAITLNENDVLDGGKILPGFTVKLKEFFAQLDNAD